MSASVSTASSSPDMNDHHNQQSQHRGRQSSSSSSINNDGGGDNQNQFIYEVGDKIYCTHDNDIYEARVMKTAIRENLPKYFVHYHGWNKNWDEWVVNDRILKINAENRLKYEESLRQQNSRRNRRSVGGSGGGGSGGGGGSTGNNSGTGSDKRSSSSTTTASNNNDRSSLSTSKSSTANQSSGNHSDGGSNVQRKSMANTSSSSLANDSMNMDEKSQTTTTSSSQSSSARRRRKRTTRLTYVTDDDHKLINIRPKFNIPKKLMDTLLEDYIQIKLRKKILRLNDLKKTAQDLLDDYLADRQLKESSIESPLANKFSKLDPPLHFQMDPFSSNLRFDNIGINTLKSCCDEYCKNIRIYFNTVLSTQLLFNLERLQYFEIFGNHHLNNNNNNNNNTDIDISNQENNQPSEVDNNYLPKIRSRKNSDTKTNSTTKQSSKKISSSSNVSTAKDQSIKEPIEIYTPIHLLRLFTRYPSYLQYYHCDQNLFRLLNIFNDDFFEYCTNNFDEYFDENNLRYYEPTIDYLERSTITGNNNKQEQSSNNNNGGGKLIKMSSMIDGDDNSSTNENIMDQD